MGPPLCAQHLPGSDAHAGHAGSRWRRRYSIDDVGAHRNHPLDPVRDIPVIGNPLADPLQPDLTHLVNLGYGDPLQGWSTGPANVATGFGLFPPLSDIEKLPGLLLSGTEQGIQRSAADGRPDQSLVPQSRHTAPASSPRTLMPATFSTRSVTDRG